MYAHIYNRLCGWSLIVVGIIGFFTSNLADYLRFSTLEASLSLGLGVLATAAARSRSRYAVVTALWLGIALFAWGTYGLAIPSSILGTAEPLDNATRLVAGAWGMYIAVHDVLDWRRRATS